MTAGSHVLDEAMREPFADIREEANWLITTCHAANVELRLLGGLAIELTRPRSERPPFQRVYQDIDVLVVPDDARNLRRLLSELGYTSDEEFNALHGRRRLLFHDTANSRQIDVFVGEFSMCHTIPVRRPGVGPRHAIPLAELLLTKLQIVELNPKDQMDILNLLFCHDVGDHDNGTINQDYVASLCAADWGLWRTCRMNTERTRQALAASDLDGADRERIAGRLGRLWERIDTEPKSRKWRMRDRVGDRVRWYEEPDEVG